MNTSYVYFDNRTAAEAFAAGMSPVVATATVTECDEDKFCVYIIYWSLD